MKQKLLSMCLVVASLLSANSTSAGTIDGTLEHTGSATVESAYTSKGNTADAEDEYYNNDATTGWSGWAFAQFSFEIPEGETVTSATLTWYLNQGGRSKSRTLYINYLNAGQTVDFSSLAGSAESTDYQFSGNRTSIVSGTSTVSALSAYEQQTTDVTDAVKAIAEAGQSYIIFQWTGNQGGATIGGSANVDYAPMLVITTADASTATTYVVEKYNGETLISTSSATSGTIGKTATVTDDDKADFTVDGVKYTFDSSNSNNVTSIKLSSTASENVLKLYFNEAEKYSYTVNATAGSETKTLVSNTDYAGNTVYYAYPYYINVDGALYTKAATNKEFKGSFTLSSDGQEETITYNASETYPSGVYYLTEVEDLEGVTAITTGNVSARCSNMGGGYTSEGITLTSLEAGKYKIVTASYGAITANFTVGETTVYTFTGGGSWFNEQTSDEFTIESAGDLVLTTPSGYSANSALDYVLVIKTGDVTAETFDVTIGDIKYCTFSADAAYSVPEGVTAYTAALGDGVVELTAIDDGIIPANTGVVLGGPAGTYTLTATTTETTISSNILLPSDTSLSGDGSYYVLGENGSDAVFAPLKEGTAMTANKAYFVKESGDAKYTVVIAGSTGISEVSSAVKSGKTYNLQGIEVNDNFKGLTIKNGKKVIK